SPRRSSREHPLGFERTVLRLVETEELAEDVAVVLAERRTGALEHGGRVRQDERRRHRGDRLEDRVRDAPPERTVPELLVLAELGDREDRLHAEAGARRHGPVRGELEERGRHELEPGLVLREVDEATIAGAPPALERGEDRDDAVADRDVVDVRPVEDHRRAVRLAEELVEAGEGGELAPVARM